jgi:NAD(P)H dehydrogenase (quinone)
MKFARNAGLPIDAISNIRYYIEDDKQDAFEIGAPTTDVPDLTGRPAEDFETIARRYAAQSRNQGEDVPEVETWLCRWRNV